MPTTVEDGLSLHDHYRYQDEGIYFHAFVNIGESKPKLLQDENTFIVRT